MTRTELQQTLTPAHFGTVESWLRALAIEVALLRADLAADAGRTMTVDDFRELLPGAVDPAQFRTALIEAGSVTSEGGNK